MKALENAFTHAIPSDLVLDYIRLFEKVGAGKKDIEGLTPLFSVYHPLVLKEDIVFLFRNFFPDSKISDTRLNSIIKRTGGIHPNNQEEIIATNITTIFDMIYGKTEFEVNANEIQSLANTIYRDTKTPNSYKYCLKNEKTYSEKLSDLTIFYKSKRAEGKIERCYLDCCFLVDFLKLSPFVYGNELIGIIIYYALTVSSNIKAFAFTSFFKKFSNIYPDYLKALDHAFFMYDSGYPDPSNLLKIMLKIDEEAYDDVHEYERERVFDDDLSKANSIENIIYKLSDTFSKEDIKRRLPTVSTSTIDRVLKKMSDEKKIGAFGRGRGAKWVRFDTSYDDKKRFLDNFKKEDNH